jgi:hypothetical protein
LSAPLIGQPWWSIPNLFASHYYTRGIVQYGPGMVTISGLGLQIFFAGMVGAICGFLTPGGRLFGLAVAFAWYFLCYLVLWKRYAPLVPVYGSQPLLIVAFFLYGSTLGWHRDLVYRIRTPG